jgi:hypothetical protein
MTTPEYVVEKFLAWTPGNPDKFQAKLNELAQQGNDLVACVNVDPNVLWLILRKNR